MKAPTVLLKCVAKALLNAGFGGLPIGDFVIDPLEAVAEDVWEWWHKKQPKAEERQAELVALTQGSVTEIAHAVAEAVATAITEVDHQTPPDEREALKRYLVGIPDNLRLLPLPPSDPLATTAPSPLADGKAIALLPLLFGRRLRFHPGDTPLPGVDWQLVELLRADRFSEVWKAKHPKFANVEPVALKLGLNLAAKDRLLHEAEVLDRVMQPGHRRAIVGLLHTYLDAAPPCLALEYVLCESLTDVIRESQASAGLSPFEAAQLTHKLSRIVGFAHRLAPPVVHGNLKPANVFVQRRRDGTVELRVAGFGVGNVRSQREIQAAAERVSYRGSYASPQQKQGEPPDARDDVYSIAVIWYQLLTADLKSKAPVGRDWRKGLEGKGMSKALLDLLEEGIEENRDQRPADAAVLAKRLKDLLSPTWLLALLESRGLNTACRIKVVRHKRHGLDIENLAREGWLELYQSYQGGLIFNCDYIVSFVGLENLRARFYGVYRVCGHGPASQRELNPAFHYPSLVNPHDDVFYELERLPEFDDLRGRVVIEWGQGALAWCQWLTKPPNVRKDKKVIAGLPTKP